MDKAVRDGEPEDGKVQLAGERRIQTRIRQHGKTKTDGKRDRESLEATRHEGSSRETEDATRVQLETERRRQLVEGVLGRD